VTAEEYSNIIVSLIGQHSLTGSVSGGKYFLGHFPRFWKQIEAIDKYIDFDTDAKVLDCGTTFPFASYYLNLKFGCEVSFCSIDNQLITINNKVKGFHCNICYDDFGTNKWDMVFLTEVLEHLPCNLIKVKEKIIRSIKPGRYLLTSHPLKGKNAHNYDKDLELDWNKSHNHLREFTEQTAESFITELKILEKHIVYTREYGGNMYQFLYKKV